MSRQQADAILASYPRGSFLVRRSQRGKGVGYVLSCRGASRKLDDKFEFAHFPIQVGQVDLGLVLVCVEPPIFYLASRGGVMEG